MSRSFFFQLFKGDLMPDGGFESARVGEPPDGWRINKAPDASANFRVVDDLAKKDTRALLLEGKGAWMSANSPQLEIDPAKKYRASAWIRVKSGQARIQISYHRDNNWIGTTDGTQRFVNDAWSCADVESEPLRFPYATHLNVAIVVDGPEVSVYADDMKVLGA